MKWSIWRCYTITKVNVVSCLCWQPSSVPVDSLVASLKHLYGLHEKNLALNQNNKMSEWALVRWPTNEKDAVICLTLRRPRFYLCGVHELIKELHLPKDKSEVIKFLGTLDLSIPHGIAEASEIMLSGGLHRLYPASCEAWWNSSEMLIWEGAHHRTASF